MTSSSEPYREVLRTVKARLRATMYQMQQRLQRIDQYGFSTVVASKKSSFGASVGRKTRLCAQ